MNMGKPIGKRDMEKRQHAWRVPGSMVVSVVAGFLQAASSGLSRQNVVGRIADKSDMTK
jgi:hypothetical protein